MSNDLISRSALEACINSWYESCSPRTDIRDMVICDTLDSVLQHIDDQPTAYDVGAVVEQLKKESYDSMHLDMSRDMTETWQIIDLDDAIDIVKAGGKA